MTQLWAMKQGRAHTLGTLRAVVRAALPSIWVELLFDPRDLWVGVYHDKPDTGWRYARNVYVCPIPTLVILLKIRNRSREQTMHDIKRAAHALPYVGDYRDVRDELRAWKTAAEIRRNEPIDVAHIDTTL